MRVQNKRHKIRKENLKNIRRQRQKYPTIAEKILEVSDIILEVLDARFPDKTRNEAFEQAVKKQRKKIIYVLNKSDLIDIKEKKKELPEDLSPYIFISSTERFGGKLLRDKIKIESKKISKLQNKIIKGDKIKESKDDNIIVGVVGYPNTGKSTMINLLVGKRVAGTGAEAGFTKGMQKLKLSEGVVLIDSPGVIPKKEYSTSEKGLIAMHTIVGGKSHSQVKDPEFVVAKIVQDFPGKIEKHYKTKSKENAEDILEELGRKWNLLKKGSEVNFDTSARKILKDWQDGTIKV